MNKIALTAIATVTLTASAASAGDLLWDNVPYGYTPESSMSSQLDLVYPFDSQVADDFVLADGGEITGVTFWGGFYNGSPVPIESFNIIFYEDAGGMPTGGPEDPTGTGTVFNVAATSTPEGADFKYEADLGAGFSADAGSTYWVAIQAVMTFPPQWGISASNSIQGSELMFGFPLLGTPYWTPGTTVFGTPRVSAFQLYGVPAPGALALLGLAGLAGRRRRA